MGEEERERLPVAADGGTLSATIGGHMMPKVAWEPVILGISGLSKSLRTPLDRT
jgi:hypothetical protein